MKQPKPAAARKSKKPTRRSLRLTVTKGSQAFAEFLAASGLTYDDAAEALAATKSGVCVWSTGQLRPRYEMRLHIERWTGGTIKPTDWLTDKESRALRGIAPFKPAKKGAS